jgi:predicted ATPase
LRLRNEWVLELGGLSIPGNKQVGQDGPADAVRLFVERAQRVAPSFALTSENAAPVAHICRQLEGMPLAIELAASWVRALSPAEIVSELARALDFLALADRDMPVRHRSMRTALEHSWNLLDVEEHFTLARLSVFRSGCDREAAISVTGATLRTIAALLDKSLVRAETSDNVTRYRLHELVRQYAAERLADDPADRRATEERHTHYYATLLQRSLDPRTGTPTGEARKTLNRNIDNLRRAWDLAVEQRNHPILATMVRGMWILHDDHGWLHDAVRLFGQAAAALRGLDGGAAIVYGHVLGLHGYFLTRVAHFIHALPLVEEALSVLQVADGPRELVGFLDYVVGMCHFHLAQPIAAGEHLASAAALAEASGDYFLDFWCEIWLGVVALYMGDYESAEAHMGKYLAAYRGQGYSRGEATALGALAEVLRHQRRYNEAFAYLQEGLRIAREAHDSLITALCLSNLGALALARGEIEEASALLNEAASLTRALGDPWHTARILFYLVQAEIAAGNAAAAHAICAELARYALGDVVVVLGESLYSYALLLHHTDNHTEAWALLGVLDSVSVSAIVVQAANSLRTELAPHLNTDQRTAALRRTKDHDLKTWLNELAQRNPPSTPATTDRSKPDKVEDLYVAETGETLSRREAEVLCQLAAGASNATIAAQLVISLHTVVSPANRHPHTILSNHSQE